MAKRVRIKEKPNNYFVSSKEDIAFVSSGCAIMDCSLGGGYALGRMVNIVGDKSTGKTALASEAIANFFIRYPDGKAAYRDIEAAFDEKYAEAMGLDVSRVDLGDGDMDTVEDFYKDFDRFLTKQMEADAPGIYIIDSLDALSDDEEMKREIDKGTYGGNKPKQIGTLFRKLVRKVERSKVLLIIVSQVRENIGVAFGEKYRRSGGKAMDFYASQILWLAHLGQIKKTINKVERVIGIKIKAQVKKNKIGFPFRSCQFEFLFGFGVDDLSANVDWLKEVRRLDAIDLKDSELKAYLKEIEGMTDDEYQKERSNVAKATRKVWNEVEVTFLPTRKKYS